MECRPDSFPMGDKYLFLAKYFYDLEGQQKILFQNNEKYFECDADREQLYNSDNCSAVANFNYVPYHDQVIHRLFFDFPNQSFVAFFQSKYTGIVTEMMRVQVQRKKFDYESNLPGNSITQAFLILPFKIVLMDDLKQQTTYTLNQITFQI